MYYTPCISEFVEGFVYEELNGDSWTKCEHQSNYPLCFLLQKIESGKIRVKSLSEDDFKFLQFKQVFDGYSPQEKTFIGKIDDKYNAEVCVTGNTARIMKFNRVYSFPEVTYYNVPCRNIFELIKQLESKNLISWPGNLRPETKIGVYDRNNTLVNIFSSVKDAAKRLKYSESGILQSLFGFKTYHRRYKFKEITK
jgi:hypothetical protein